MPPEPLTFDFTEYLAFKPTTRSPMINRWKIQYERLEEQCRVLQARLAEQKSSLTQVEVRAMLNTALSAAGLRKLNVTRNNSKAAFISGVSTDLWKILSPKEQVEDVLAE